MRRMFIADLKIDYPHNSAFIYTDKDQTDLDTDPLSSPFRLCGLPFFPGITASERHYTYADIATQQSRCLRER